MTNPQGLKTIGFTPFSYHANQPLFRINTGVPVIICRICARQSLMMW